LSIGEVLPLPLIVPHRSNPAARKADRNKTGKNEKPFKGGLRAIGCSVAAAAFAIVWNH